MSRFFSFKVLLFSSRTNDPSACLIENTCIRFSPSAVSIPFDFRHPWEACADLPQGDLVYMYYFISKHGKIGEIWKRPGPPGQSIMKIQPNLEESAQVKHVFC